MQIYVFDGSFEGLLSLIFDWYFRKPGTIQVVTEATFQPSAFSPVHWVNTDTEKANRVYKGLRKNLSAAGWRTFYCTYLSELPEAYQHLFQFATYVFTMGTRAEKNYGNEDVLFVSQTTWKVEREKHHMEAFVRFQQTRDGIYYAPIEPRYNVLPLIVRHFADRYADQAWIIYDHLRKYGLYYDLNKLETITIDFYNGKSDQLPAAISSNNNEEVYQLLWKDYFRTANIPARKNTKLHVRNLPKRFWRYLTEKQME
ncbi:MAG: TIGR03915 family putative DNA repair protein [Siphonobacter sp.]